MERYSTFNRRAYIPDKPCTMDCKNKDRLKHEFISFETLLKCITCKNYTKKDNFEFRKKNESTDP